MGVNSSDLSSAAFQTTTQTTSNLSMTTPFSKIQFKILFQLPGVPTRLEYAKCDLRSLEKFSSEMSNVYEKIEKMYFAP